MAASSTTNDTPTIESDESGLQIALKGCWTFSTLSGTRSRTLSDELKRVDGARWDLSGVTAIDSVGALLLWKHWGRRLPPDLHLRREQEDLFQALDQGARRKPEPRQHAHVLWITAFGEKVLDALHNLYGILQIFGRFVLASGYLVARWREAPWKELSANIFSAGVQALGITAIVGFLIGIVLSYLSAQQLARYGANILIVDLLGISILRELGPLLAAILVAGRSGSALTAQLGIMKINQELDAMMSLGISQTLRLAWPKVLALMVAMPLLAFWTDIWALAGGMLSAQYELGFAVNQFLERLPAAVGMKHLWIGLGKSVCFGAIIGLIGCHFGFTVQPNSESVGQHTTRSVVTAITTVILADAFFAIVLSFDAGTLV